MSKRISSFALPLALALVASPALAQTVDPREPPMALPNGSFFPPSVPLTPAQATGGPVEYLPSEMGGLGIAGDEFAPRLWIDPEAVLWRVRKGQVAFPLATTGTPAGFGILNRSGTVVRSSNQVDYETMLGARLMAGVWYDDAHTWGMEGGFTWFGRKSDVLTLSSDATGNPVIARPYRDAATGTEASRVVSLPGSFAGTLTVDSSISLWGAEFNPLVLRLSQGERYYFYGLMGFKFLSLNERMTISDRVTTLANGQATFNGMAQGPGSMVGVTDSFDAANNMYGGQVGARFGWDYNRFFFDTTAKLGIMHNHQILDVSGGTTILYPPFFRRPTTAVGGLLTGPLNSRRETQAAFAIIPEVNAQIGFQLTSRMSIFVGYNFMYISSVIRPEDQLDRTVNSGNSPSSPSFGAVINSRRPYPFYNRNEFLAQGASVGLSFRY